ncbi:MAG TPA: hypothetical protein VIO38_17405 [Rariglobus sp.]
MTAPVQEKAASKDQPVLMRPFVAGTRRVDKSTYDESRVLNAGTQDLRTYECDPNGFLGGMYLYVTCITAANAATVTFAADGPTNVIDTIVFNDTNNKPILGPMTGFDLEIAILHGGYSFQDDPRLSPIYSATAGAGATGGSFSFILLVPIELVHRDALGSLPNKSSSATFDVSIRLASSAVPYGTPPTTPGTVRVRIQQFGWMDPNAADMSGNRVAQNPPGVQTTQYWAKQTYALNSGALSQRLLGIDSYVRNLIFMLYTGTSRTNGDANFPDPFTLLYETSTPISRIKAVWQHMIGQLYGYNGTTPDVAGARRYGVYPETYAQDFYAKPGYETRYGYLPVSSATTLNISGTIGNTGGAAHTLVVLVNKVVPASGNPLALTGGR